MEIHLQFHVQYVLLCASLYTTQQLNKTFLAIFCPGFYAVT